MRTVHILGGLLILVTTALLWFLQPPAHKPFRGQLIFAHEARSIQLCGDEREYWVSAHGDVLVELRERYRALAQTPYMPLYVELTGVVLEEPPGEFAADYDGAIEITSVTTLTKEFPRECDVATSLKTFVFVCDDNAAVTFRIEHADGWLFLSDGTLKLKASQPERWNKGSTSVELDIPRAVIEHNGTTRTCLNDPRQAIWEHAKLNGADFRGQGNEPGWYVEVLAQSRLVLTTNYGATVVERPLPVAQTIDDGSTRFDAGDLVLEIRNKPCMDTMSDETFESAVTVQWRKRMLNGCGRALH